MLNNTPKPRYPWDKWFSRRQFRLTRGRHFHCQTHGMSQQVRTAAAKRGLQVSIQVEEDTLIVTNWTVPTAEVK